MRIRVTTLLRRARESPHGVAFVMPVRPELGIPRAGAWLTIDRESVAARDRLAEERIRAGVT